MPPSMGQDKLVFFLAYMVSLSLTCKAVFHEQGSKLLRANFG